MTLRTSQVFAASRNATQDESIANIRATLVPAFNAECFDIDKSHAETLEMYKNQALADNKRKARIMMLMHSRQEVLKTARAEFESKINELVEKLGGVEFTAREIPKGKDKEVDVRKVKFPDGSVARLPSFYIPYDDFQKV